MRTLCVLLALAGTARAQAADFFGARVAAERGRVLLVRDGQAIEIVRPGRTIGVNTAAHLEIGAAAAACISWPGAMSLRLTGPIAIEWGTAAESPNTTADTEPSLDVSVLELGKIEIEIRAGRARLALPGGYVSWFGTGAFRIEGTARGGFDIENRAGSAVKIGRELAHERVRPAVWLEPGGRAPLDPREVAPRTPDLTSQALPWPEVEWPFGIAAQELPRAEPPTPTAAPTVSPVDAAVIEVPAVEPTQPEAKTPDEKPIAPAVVEHEPKPAVVEALSVPEQEFRSAEWRNLSRASLAPHGAVVVQVTPALTVKRSDGDRLDVELSREATASAWVLGPKADIELQPGARVFFDTSGVLTAHIGSIHVVDLAAPRPRWSDLAPEK
jgi:hypothetical protein